MERIEVLVVGGGQAGIATSEHLGRAGVAHLVIERGRIAERWRSARWDSLVANGPAWHDRFPGMQFPDTPPEGFPGKDEVARYFEDYAAMIGAPLRCGVAVTGARRHPDRPGFHVDTDAGPLDARYLVVATGPFQRPLIPPLVPGDAGVEQLHSTAYRNPGQLPPGAVVVVGAGSSGAQIADELLRAGRKVFLSVGPHDRPPRRYRGRDFCWWLGVLGLWDATARAPGTEHVTIAVSGAHGGETVDFRRFAARGMVLLGRTQGFAEGALQFSPDLADNIRAGDANHLSVLDAADAFAARNGLDLPPEPEARALLPDPACMTRPILRLDLAGAGVGSIVWATGFAPEYGWLEAPVFDAAGRPMHSRGVTGEPGLYFVGLPWQSRRGSAFIWGVWHDARYIADQIVKHRAYMHHHGDALP